MMKSTYRSLATGHRPRISRVLIANRGEIAVRVIRTCREMGITSVAVFSEADRGALHVRLADEAYALGPTAPAQSYLSIPKLIDIARRAQVDAVHPGYGFLAENPDFARAVQAAKCRWIGPSAAVITALGSKVAARRLAQQARVPTIPGTMKPVQTLRAATTAAKKIGFPLLIKAVAGGGGKGMRVVHTPDEFARAFELAQGEAQSAFGNGDCYLEKRIEEPHHIEVQILADRSGNTIHLGERECSIQRRHQKLVEETPSPFISDKTRKALCSAAIRLMKAAKYCNAGTVEFLVDGQGKYYFLEVNTRIQVEHPITELVTGIDIVRAQITIAEGKQLPWKQSAIATHGHAIECRICAEDPQQQFMPSPGIVARLIEPQGNGVRLDCGIADTGVVPMEYDPLIGKLCAWGPTRAEAITRMQRALRECHVSGVTTTLFFHGQVMAHSAFRAGNYATDFIERLGAETMTPDEMRADHALIAAAVTRALMEQRPTGRAKPTRSSWKTSGRHQGVRSEMEYC
jgi:acetyl-CoA carboxylase, biotin carboxylase subunit